MTATLVCYLARPIGSPVIESQVILFKLVENHHVGGLVLLRLIMGSVPGLSVVRAVAASGASDVASQHFLATRGRTGSHLYGEVYKFTHPAVELVRPTGLSQPSKLMDGGGAENFLFDPYPCGWIEQSSPALRLALNIGTSDIRLSGSTDCQLLRLQYNAGIPTPFRLFSEPLSSGGLNWYGFAAINFDVVSSVRKSGLHCTSPLIPSIVVPFHRDCHRLRTRQRRCRFNSTDSALCCTGLSTCPDARRHAILWPAFLSGSARVIEPFLNKDGNQRICLVVIPRDGVLLDGGAGSKHGWVTGSRGRASRLATGGGAGDP